MSRVHIDVCHSFRHSYLHEDAELNMTQFGVKRKKEVLPLVGSTHRLPHKAAIFIHMISRAVLAITAGTATCHWIVVGIMIGIRNTLV